MPHHHHHHGADKWTIVGSIGEAISQTASSYAIGQTIDYLFSCSVYTIGLSEAGITGFAVASALTTFGCVYSHFKVNKNNQDCNHDHGDTLVDSSEDEDIEEGFENSKEKLKPLLSSEHKHDNHDHHGHHDDHEDHDHDHDSHTKTHLSSLDYFALVGDATGHTLEVAAPLTYVINKATNNNLSTLLKTGSLILSVGLGVAAAKANVRTCANNMLPKDHDEKPSKTDGWTYFSGFIEALSYMTSNPYWIGQFIDTCGALTIYKLDLSLPAMITGLSISACTTAASFYAHRILNTNNQHATGVLTTSQSAMTLTPTQYTVIGLDFISHTSEVAPKMTFVLELMTKDQNLSQTTKILMQLGASVVGGVCAIANTRTCKNNLKKYASHQENAFDQAVQFTSSSIRKAAQAARVLGQFSGTRSTTEATYQTLPQDELKDEFKQVNDEYKPPSSALPNL